MWCFAKGYCINFNNSGGTSGWSMYSVSVNTFPKEQTCTDVSGVEGISHSILQVRGYTAKKSLEIAV